MIDSFNKFVPWALVMMIAAGAFLLMFNASLQESATMDELAHIPAGYGYVRYLDFRLNPEHPPLVKALAAFPLLFQKLNFPVNQSSWQADVNGQWAAGAQFLYESGNDADKIIQWSRLGPMLLALLLIIFIYIWAKELIGRWWALLPTFLFGLSPTVLAHGHYVTTDIGAALGTFIAIYYFVKLLFQPNRRHLIFAGLAFGAAQLMKFSVVLLIPFFVFLILAFYFYKVYNDRQKYLAKTFRCLKMLAVVFIIGYVLVYAFYFLFTVNYPVEKQVADTKFILASLAGGYGENWDACKLNFDVNLSRLIKCLAKTNIWMAGSKLLRPLGEYMLGVLMVFQRSAGGNTAYFLGEVSAVGWWHYFPVVFILKEPLPSLILITLALILALWRIIKRSRFSSLIPRFFDYLAIHFAEFSMLTFIILYWAYSVKSPLNIGVRHILPTLPFIYILTAAGLKKWTAGKAITYENFWKKTFSFLANFVKTSLKNVLLIVLAIWYLAETFFAAPYFLPYFNQLGGGTDNGYRRVTDSNYDWGQDLKRLKDWTDKNLPAGKQIAVDYFGGGNPKYYLGDKLEYWWSAKDNPKEKGIQWLAISVNTLQNAFGQLHPGHQRNPEDEYRWLKNHYEPHTRAGKSLFIYKLF